MSFVAGVFDAELTVFPEGLTAAEQGALQQFDCAA